MSAWLRRTRSVLLDDFFAFSKPNKSGSPTHRKLILLISIADKVLTILYLHISNRKSLKLSEKRKPEHSLTSLSREKLSFSRWIPHRRAFLLPVTPLFSVQNRNTAPCNHDQPEQGLPIRSHFLLPFCLNDPPSLAWVGLWVGAKTKSFSFCTRSRQGKVYCAPSELSPRKDDEDDELRRWRRRRWKIAT